MKKIHCAVLRTLFLCFAIFFTIFPAYSQDDGPCLTQVENVPDGLPNYLDPNWTQPRTISVAIVYFDFPDGRYTDRHGNKQQPLTISQLSGLNLDAVGELGLTNTISPYPVTTSLNTTLYANAIKYEQHDRWKMFFSNASYLGNEHPDYMTHHAIPECKDEAYGSMADYWKEVSNNKVIISPAETHPLETNPELRSGIVNNCLDVNGRKIIEYITLGKDKYGSSSQNAYFPDSNSFFGSDWSNTFYNLEGDMYSAFHEAYMERKIPYDYTHYTENGVKLIFVFAGSHNAFKGVTGSASVVRCMNGQPGSQMCRIDGIANMMHEFAHNAFTFNGNRWNHVVSGRNDLMNANQTKDINCPSHPNPVFKLEQGWITAIPLEHSQDVNNLPPIETSGQCGVITIYGKPSASPDNLSGECYVVENRKRIGFDKLLFKDEAAYASISGGLLIWHYSPYKGFSTPPCPISSYEPSIKFIAANGVTDLCGSAGDNPDLFFASQELQGIHSFNIDKSYSAEGLKTGIRISNIRQNDYNDVNSSMAFTLEYTISEPTAYDYVIYPRGGATHTDDVHGKIFYHKPDLDINNNTLANYIFRDNSVIEIVKYYLNLQNRAALLSPFSVRASDANPVIFRGAGYKNQSESYINTYEGIKVYGSVFSDSVISENIKIENVVNNMAKIEISAFPNKVSKVKNIVIDEKNMSGYDIILNNNTYQEITLNNSRIKLGGSNVNIQDQISINNCDLVFYAIIKFSPTSNFECVQSRITNKLFENNVHSPLTLTTPVSTSLWQGIEAEESDVDLEGVTFTNANTAIQSNNSPYIFHLVNCTFNNSLNHDVIVFNPALHTEVNILNNTFNCNTDIQYSSVACSDVPELQIANNTFNHIGQFGITLMYCPNAVVSDNTISGGNIYDGYSTGLLSYSSGGNISCNTITDCMQDGMLLDNSQPVLNSNILDNNGVGLYLTNNSHPIMTEGFTANQTYEIGGLNRITNSAGPEIYCDNDRRHYSVPEINYGNNMIEDNLHGFNLPDSLIFNSDIITTPSTIHCSDNFWGGNDPYGRLIPSYSFGYRSYLSDYVHNTCGQGMIDADNSDIPQDLLLLGNYMVARYQNDNTAALGYAYDLYNLPSSDISRVVPLNNIFYTSLQNNSDLVALESFYSGIAGNTADTIVSKKANNLKIETKVEEEMLTPALNDYEAIINTSDNDVEIFYAKLNRMRVYSLILDSLLSHYHNNGDSYSVQTNTHTRDGSAIQNNSPQNTAAVRTLNENILKCLNNFNMDKVSNVNSDASLKENRLNKEGSRGNNTKDGKNTLQVTPAKNKLLSKLEEQVSSKLSKLGSMSSGEKKELLMNSMLVKIAVKNYNPNIGSISKSRTKTLTNNNIVLSYKLDQNYPNPFNPSTTIKYALPKAGIVSVKVYDMVGRMVKELVNGYRDVGNYSVTFDGSGFASGVYFYRIEANNFIDTKRMVLVK